MLLDFIELDTDKKGEIYKKLYLEIKRAVECGVIKQNERLPSVREAAQQLGVSRTTVENAYMRLCVEGIAESKPQKGYYITKEKIKTPQKQIVKREDNNNIKYDFSSRRIDSVAADVKGWKKSVREVLWDSGELTSYGDAQGEQKLRMAICDYAYKARGVNSTPQNIILGAGIGPLLNILCGLLGRKIKVGFDNNGFKKAENIFKDYGIETEIIASDKNGVIVEELNKNKIDVLFSLPSALSKISVTGLSNRRNKINEWLKQGNHRYIIEDDYNGELRYTARTVSCFQGKNPEKTIYIGSFSKLLLPSVRIAFMVLPDELLTLFYDKQGNYNQTCGKIEQLALADYILNGSLEKHLKRLRKLYYNKSQILIREIKTQIPAVKSIELFESSLMLELQTTLPIESKKICEILAQNSIKVIESEHLGSIKISFAGIEQDEIFEATQTLAHIFLKIEKIVN